VKTQIWIAVSVYVLVAIVRKRLRLEVSLYTLLQVFSVTVFEKMPIQSALFATPYRLDDAEGNRGQTTGTGMPCAPERQKPGNKMLGFAPINRGVGVL
jgi:hypothetical protein